MWVVVETEKSAFTFSFGLGFTASLVILCLQFHATRCSLHRRWHVKCLLSISLESSFCHFNESFLNACACNSASFIEEHVVVITSPLLTASTCNLSFWLLVQLVANTDEGEALWIRRPSVFMEAITPAWERIERLLACDIIDESTAIGTAVEGVSQRLELFLASRVPNLQCHNSVVY